METKNKNKNNITPFRVNYNYTLQELLERENKILKEKLNHLKKEIEKFREPPLIAVEVIEEQKNNYLIRLPNGNEFLVKKDFKGKLLPGDYVLCEQKNLVIIKKIGRRRGFNVNKFVIIEKPKTRWKDIGGLENQVNEIKEVVELPLKKPELFKKIGITPPKGILLYGPPGTGKTLLAKAVANATHSTFIEIVGSELVQKFIGEGAKLVKDIFKLAKDKAPSIIFIDEIDSIAAKRVEIGTSGEREVQRTFMQLLAEIDGFKPLGSVKVIGCTNRIDIVDPALLRPGRLDRLIHVGLPTPEGIKAIFMIHTKNMPLSTKINIDRIINKAYKLKMSGADIKAMCTEAGYFAIREKRKIIKEQDFIKAIEKIKKEKEDESYKRVFG